MFIFQYFVCFFALLHLDCLALNAFQRREYSVSLDTDNIFNFSIFPDRTKSNEE